MSPVDDNEREFGGDEALAAEYVLGVLPTEERQQAASRIETDPDFARLVDGWEARLAPLADAYEDVPPPASVAPALERRLFASANASQSTKPGFWQSLAVWRALAAASVVALALVVLAPLLAPSGGKPGDKLVASLAHEGSDVAFFAMYDAQTGEIGLSHVAGERQTGRDFELWVIEGQNPPRSLGVIPVGEAMRMPVPAGMEPMIGSGSTFAISVEPSGGSPTGSPTGPVVAAGSLRQI